MRKIPQTDSGDEWNSVLQCVSALQQLCSRKVEGEAVRVASEQERELEDFADTHSDGNLRKILDGQPRARQGRKEPAKRPGDPARPSGYEHVRGVEPGY